MLMLWAWSYWEIISDGNQRRVEDIFVWLCDDQTCLALYTVANDQNIMKPLLS